MLGLIWRFFASVLDWRLFLRRLRGDSSFEVVFIANIRDSIDKKRFLANWIPPLGHFNGPKYYFRGISGRTRAIFSLTEDIQHNRTSQTAKVQCISAIEYVQERGAKVILLAASTKRLFGSEGKEIKEMFPNLFFTIGDNGTFFLLLCETLRAFNKSNLLPGKSRICVIGPYGFLGELMVRHLVSKGYDVVGVGSSEAKLKKLNKEYGIEFATSFGEVGKVDAVVACTHSNAVRLKKDTIHLIRRDDRKLLVIDVSEPNNLVESEYELSKDFIVRQDAGNGYSPKLKYVLGFITYKMFRLTQGITFGCFMEALVLRKAMKDDSDNKELKSLDFFNVNDENIKIISELFTKYDVHIPNPKCFGKKVKSFDLYLPSVCGKEHLDRYYEAEVALEEDESKIF